MDLASQVLAKFQDEHDLCVWQVPDELEDIIKAIFEYYCGLSKYSVAKAVQDVRKYGIYRNHLSYMDVATLREVFGFSISEALDFQRAAKMVKLDAYLGNLGRNVLQKLLDDEIPFRDVITPEFYL